MASSQELASIQSFCTHQSGSLVCVLSIARTHGLESHPKRGAEHVEEDHNKMLLFTIAESHQIRITTRFLFELFPQVIVVPFTLADGETKNVLAGFDEHTANACNALNINKNVFNPV